MTRPNQPKAIDAARVGCGFMMEVRRPNKIWCGVRSGGGITLAWLALAVASWVFPACAGPQSALDPAGDAAAEIAGLFWRMTIGAVIMWLAVAGLGAYAIRGRQSANQARQAKLLIIGGGALVPTLVLGVLLVHGLAMLPKLMARAPDGSLRIAVTGEQWWWRVRYQPPGGAEVVLANELRLPAGEPVELELDSPDVIHSFWVPSLAGKMDMIPGRRTRLVFTPTRIGTFRGVCAEYCGTAHALMAFRVVVMDKANFEQWLDEQRQPALEPAEPVAVEGRELFLTNGCSACHSIRGSEADGFVGPDLTHVGSRLSLGAGILPNDVSSLTKWIARTHLVKPGVHMPHFQMLPPEELRAMATYLNSLR